LDSSFHAAIFVVQSVLISVFVGFATEAVQKSSEDHEANNSNNNNKNNILV